jgi:hypothetical protein
MHNKKTILIFIVGALAVAMTFGAVAYSTVFAGTPTTTSSNPSLTADSTLGIGRGHFGGYTSEDLANALGITVDELTAAYDEAYSTALSQAVSDGLITQAQADQLADNGIAFPFGGRWEGFLLQNGIDFNTFLAEALNISIEELKSAYQTATYARIDQAVTNGKLTQEQADLMKGRSALFNDTTFQSSMKSAFTGAVNQAVTSGVITQSQADQILSDSGNFLKPGMGGIGGPGGRHGHGGDWINGGNLEIAP